VLADIDCGDRTTIAGAVSASTSAVTVAGACGSAVSSSCSCSWRAIT
jgi:hypothetical protein